MKDTLRFAWISLALILVCAWAQAAGPVTQYQRNFGATSATTSAWGTIVTSLTRDVNYVDVNSTIQMGTIILGLGVYGSEYNALYIQGSVAQNRTIPLFIPKGKRVSIKALNNSVVTGGLILNFVE